MEIKECENSVSTSVVPVVLFLGCLNDLKASLTHKTKTHNENKGQVEPVAVVIGKRLALLAPVFKPCLIYSYLTM